VDVGGVRERNRDGRTGQNKPAKHPRGTTPVRLAFLIRRTDARNLAVGNACIQLIIKI
jgi:hypothetical protein